MTNKKRHVKIDTNTKKYIGYCIDIIDFVKRFDLEFPIIVELDGYSVTVEKIKELES